MKITFITPPSAFQLDERVFVSLGILKVAAAAENQGFHVEHLDLSGLSDYEAVAEQHFSTSASDVAAFTATTPQMPSAYRIAKRLEPFGVKRVLGGAHVTLVRGACRRERVADRAHRAMNQLFQAFDVCVAGDGEPSIGEAVKAKPGTVLDADSPSSPWWLSDAALAPWPNRELIDVSTYHYRIDGKPALSLIGQLGCPFNCQFCAGRNTPFLRKIRVRPAEDVVAEMLHIHERYGITSLMFLDDELNVNKQFFPLLKKIKGTGIRWSLRGLLKSELFTDAQAGAMAEAGFKQILSGFESGDPRILENIQKKATREENTRTIEIARRHGLSVKALMSVGHAGESEESILNTRDWLLEMKPNDFDVTVIQPYPGSPYYDDAIPLKDGSYLYTAKNGDPLYMEDVDLASSEAQYYKGVPGCYRSFVWTDQLSRERICELRDAVEDEVRTKLNLPYPAGAGVRYEASMGALPGHILRTTMVKTNG